jgi:hypothetical protein
MGRFDAGANTDAGNRTVACHQGRSADTALTERISEPIMPPVAARLNSSIISSRMAVAGRARQPRVRGCNSSGPSNGTSSARAGLTARRNADGARVSPTVRVNGGELPAALLAAFVAAPVTAGYLQSSRRRTPAGERLETAVPLRFPAGALSRAPAVGAVAPIVMVSGDPRCRTRSAADR